MSKAKKQVESIPTAETIEAALPAPAESQLPAVRGPSASMLAMFAASDDLRAKVAAGKVKRLTLPPIIKPASVGPGCSFMGRIVGIIDSPVSTYKSKLLQMTHPTGGDFCWPANAVTCGALAGIVGCSREALNLDNPQTVKKLVGVTILVEGLGPTRHSDGKRNVNLYNVAQVLD